MIKIDKLSKKYDKDYVLKDLSCNIKDNSIYGLVGANGSGKSTLLRTIMGIYEADGGVISVDGEEVYDNEIMKQKMVFVQDDLFFYPGYTLMDTAKWYEAMYKNFDKEDFEDFDILSFKKQGSVATIIIKDNDGKSKKKLEKMKPLILDYLPLTLEEVFIYEMEALGYEFNKFV